MNYVTQSFEEFSKSLGPTDLALYAGAAVVLWILFKEKLSPVQKFLVGLFDKIKGWTPKKTVDSVVSNSDNKELFFQLVESWKRTRDLAVKSGCDQAVKVADDMFPFLSPTACNKDEKVSV